MKKLIGFGLVLMLAVPVMAQLAGLPIAGGAGLSQPGALNVSGGAVIGDDFNTYGMRLGYAVLDDLTLFGDVGVLDPDYGDTGWAFQGGGLVALPLKGLPVDVALRGSLGYAGYDVRGGDVRMMNLMGGVLVSKTIEQFTPYAFLGLNYIDAEVKVRGHGKYSDDETDLAIAGGVECALTEQVSLYGELVYIDDLFVGFGGRWRF